MSWNWQDGEECGGATSFVILIDLCLPFTVTPSLNLHLRSIHVLGNFEILTKNYLKKNNLTKKSVKNHDTVTKGNVIHTAD